MKIKKMNKIILPVIITTLIFTNNCGENKNNVKITQVTEETINTTNVITNVTNIQSTVINLMKQKLNRNLEPSDIKYEVSDTKIASITGDGSLIPLKNGNVDIIVKSKSTGEMLQKFNVNVQVYEIPTLKIEKGRTVNFDFYEKDVLWSTSNEKVASVSAGKVTGVDKGETEIKITDKNNQELSKIKVIVE